MFYLVIKDQSNLHDEDLMLHFFNDPLVNLLHSLVKGEFSRFINATIGSNGKVELSFFEFIFPPKEVECKLQLCIHFLEWLH